MWYGLYYFEADYDTFVSDFCMVIVGLAEMKLLFIEAFILSMSP